jgi:hypothetical protein
MCKSRYQHSYDANWDIVKDKSIINEHTMTRDDIHKYLKTFIAGITVYTPKKESIDHE